MEYQWRDTEICGVGVIFVGLDGRVIVQQRDQHAKNAPGMLAVFGGGKEDGETPRACLEREMKEEINITFNSKKHNLSILCDTINTAVAEDDKVRIYVVIGIDPSEIVIGEGVGFAQLSEVESRSHEITPFTKEMLAMYWEQKRDL